MSSFRSAQARAASLLAVGGVLGALLLAGCTPVSVSVSSDGSIADPDAVQQWQEQVKTKTIDWGECELPPIAAETSPAFDETKLQCAKVPVPVDWKDQSGKAEISVLRVLPTGTLEGHVFTNPGGPGEPGTTLPLQLMSLPATEQLREHHALVGIDPRGVGRVNGGSEPFECGEDPEDVDACSSKFSKHASTSEVAFDMEYVRQLLGEKQLDYYGASYGTYLGAIYATIFPDQVGKMLLDSATGPDYGSPHEPEDQQQTPGFEQALERFLGACVGGELSVCPFTGTIPEAKTQLIELRDRLNAHPASFGDVSITGDMVVEASTSTFYQSTDGWDALAVSLNGLITGNLPDPTVFNGSMEVPDIYEIAIGCATDAGSEADTSRPAPVPAAGGNFYVDDSDDSDICSGKNKPAWTDPAVHYSGKSRILIISGTGDAATRIAGATAMREALENATLVTVEGEGHGWSFAGRSACVDDIANQYLVKGTLPTVRYCVAEHP